MQLVKNMNYRAFCLAFGLVLSTLNMAWSQVQFNGFLGDAPTAPADVSKLPKGAERLTGGTTLSVNTASREQVRQFYNCIYTSSDGVPINTTGNAAACLAGTSSSEFVVAVQRRINWIRALAGVPAVISFDAANSLKNQLAAEMMSANNALSHTPPSSWTCYTSDGATAAQNSNLSLGFYGPDAITGYIWDAGANNTVVGHRRWILYPQTRIMGTGDLPVNGSYNSANATWVFDGNYGGTRPATRTPYISWPPAGYVPFQLVYPRWSFSYPNADFSTATISMSSNGVAMSTTIESTHSGYGENTIVWYPSQINPGDYSTLFPFSGTDTPYSINVNNVVVGGKSTNFTYTVTVFDPQVLGVDYSPTVISGSNQVMAGIASSFICSAVTNATGYQWRLGVRSPDDMIDGGENGLTNFTATATSDYSVVVTSPKASGSFAFHLAHVSSPYNAYLQINHLVLPGSNCVLSFKSRLSYATSDEIAKVQISTSGGAAWKDLYSQAGTGATESGFVTRSISLSNYVAVPVQLRWAYLFDSGSYYSGANPNTGWYLDDITLTNAEQVAGLIISKTDAPSFSFAAPLATNYMLQAAGVLFSEFPMEWGPTKLVAAVPPPPTVVVGIPILTNRQAQINFRLSSGAATSFVLLESGNISGPWTTNKSAFITTNSTGQSFRFTTSTNGPTRFYQLRVW